MWWSLKMRSRNHPYEGSLIQKDDKSYMFHNAAFLLSLNEKAKYFVNQHMDYIFSFLSQGYKGKDLKHQYLIKVRELYGCGYVNINGVYGSTHISDILPEKGFDYLIKNAQNILYEVGCYKSSISKTILDYESKIKYPLKSSNRYQDYLNYLDQSPPYFILTNDKNKYYKIVPTREDATYVFDKPLRLDRYNYLRINKATGEYKVYDSMQEAHSGAVTPYEVIELLHESLKPKGYDKAIKAQEERKFENKQMLRRRAYVNFQKSKGVDMSGLRRSILIEMMNDE
jgi:hypothetical protein